MYYLIDGYNFVLASRLARSLGGPGNLLRARDRLLSWLSSHLDESELARTTVVYDAKMRSAETREQNVNGVRILFAVDYPDADSMIESLIERHAAPKQLTVVSSDSRIQEAARRRHAAAVRSLDWFEQMESRAQAQARHSSEGGEEKPVVGDRDQLISEFDTPDIQHLIDDAEKSERVNPLRRRGKR